MTVLKSLTLEQVQKLAERKGAKKIAVENFLLTSAGWTYSDCIANLDLDARLFKWNAATVKAIRDGLILANKK